MRIHKGELTISAGTWHLLFGTNHTQYCPKNLSEWKEATLEATLVSASNVVQVQGKSPRSPDNISKDGPGQRATVVKWNGAHQICIRVNGPYPLHRRTALG